MITAIAIGIVVLVLVLWVCLCVTVEDPRIAYLDEMRQRGCSQDEILDAFFRMEV